mgnify:CR=1 FL=1
MGPGGMSLSGLFVLEISVAGTKVRNRKKWLSGLTGLLVLGGALLLNELGLLNITFASLLPYWPVILILGGVDKGNDYELIRELVGEKVKAIVCLGEDNRKIHEAFDQRVPVIVDTQSADEAVFTAYHLAKKGDTVLLSPACASFDLFKNFEDRGEAFKQYVKNLK